VAVLALLAVGFFGVRVSYSDTHFLRADKKLYSRDHTPIPDTPLDPQFAQTLQSNKFGHLDTDTLPASGGPKLVADEQRRAAIKEAFVWSFEAYEKYAWGDDELQPLSMTGTNLTSVGAVGYTIIDSIGSLLIMDLIPQYQHARDWVRDSLDFDKDAQFNTFEVCSYVFDECRADGRLRSVYLEDFYQRTTSLPPTLYQRFEQMLNST
jgi:hypothetical protein